MNYKNISLPYPVLGICDDVYPLLEEDCVRMAPPIKTPLSYKFSIELTQRNREITELVEAHKAEYACEVSCRNTLLRRCYKSYSPHFDITLSRTEVSGRIDFQCFIAVNQPIKGYTNSDFNEDYIGFSFDLELGDMLAVFPSAWWNTNVKYDKLYAAGSFMQIIEAAEDRDKVWFNLNAERIMIESPHDLFVQYLRIGNTFPEIIHSSLVHNALVYALANLEEYGDSGHLWSDSLKVRLCDPQFAGLNLNDMNDVYVAADLLLQNPYKRMLDGLEKLAEAQKEELEG